MQYGKSRLRNLALQVLLVLTYGPMAWGQVEAKFVCSDEYNRVFYTAQQSIYQHNLGGTPKLIYRDTNTISCILQCGNTMYIGTSQNQVLLIDLYSGRVLNSVSISYQISELLYFQNAVCIATQGGGLFTTTKALQNLKRINSSSFVYDMDTCNNALYCGTDSGICKYTGSGFRAVTITDSLPDVIINKLSVSANHIFAACNTGELIAIDITKKKSPIIILGRCKGLPQKLISNNFRLFVLCAMDTKCTTTSSTFQCTILAGNDAVFNANDDLVLASDKAISTITHDKTFSSTSGLPNAKLQCTTNSGVCVFASGSYSTFYTSTGKTVKIKVSGEITSICATKANTVWLGNAGGQITEVSDQGRIIRKIQTNEAGQAVLSVAQLGDKIYSATLAGVYTYDTLTEAVQSVLQCRENKILYVYQLLADSSRLWLATDGQGLCCLHDGKMMVNMIKNGTAKVIYSMVQDPDGNIWCALQNQGLCQYNTTTHRSTILQNRNGLSDNTVLGLSMLSGNLLAVTTVRAVNIINIKTMQVAQYKSAQQLQASSGMAVSGKQIYLCSDSGLIRFNAAAHLKTQFDCRIRVDAFDAKGELLRNPRPQLNASANSISFKLQHYLPCAEHEYVRYKLVNHSASWIVTSDDQIAFNNLDAGTYVLQVELANNSDFFNACNAQYLFSVSPHWYERWWVILMAASLLAYLVRAYVLSRERQQMQFEHLQQQQLEARFESLKTQINPHFLFNSLNSLVQLIEIKDEKAAEYAQQISNFYRSLLAVKTDNLIPLQQEMQMLNRYLYLQGIRYGNFFSFDCTVDQVDVSGIIIPPLTLQILAENVFKHNAIDAGHTIKIRLYIADNQLILSNNKHEKFTKEPSEGLGLPNITDRYQILTKKSIVIEDTKDYFTIKLPIIKS
jgi:hypothetical protein